VNAQPRTRATVHELTPPPARRDRAVRVALVNDFELVVRGLEAILEPFRDEIVVVEADVREGPRAPVDVALFDTYGHRGDGIERVRELAVDLRSGAVAVYAWNLGREHIDALRAAGARGVLDKAMPGAELAHAIRAIAQGEVVVSATFHRATRESESWPGHEFGLSARESEVASLLLRGLSNREIAGAMHISEHTVKTHLKAIFNKTATRSRGQAVARIAASGEFRRMTSC
jgi:DNA-binding NarL/FixJ family response regulator